MKGIFTFIGIKQLHFLQVELRLKNSQELHISNLFLDEVRIFVFCIIFRIFFLNSFY